jgi:5'-nucleotidase
MTKKIVFIDMDGVLVDLEASINNMRKSHRSYENIDGDMIHGVFRDAPMMKGCKEGIQRLIHSNRFELFIASTTPWNHPEAAADKLWWLQKHFGDVFKKRVFFTHRKDLLVGDYLIDDRKANGASDFKGTFIHFKTENNDEWNDIVAYLLKQK